MRFELGPPVSWMNGLHGSGPRKKLGLWILPHQQLSIITTLPQKQNLLSAHQTGGSTNLVADLDGKFWSRRQSPKKSPESSTVLKHSSWGTRFGMNQSRSHSVFILRYHPLSALTPSHLPAISFSRKSPAASPGRRHQPKNTLLQEYLL